MFDRRMYREWVGAGEPTAAKAAREIAREAIGRHTVSPLPAAALDVMKGIIAEADARADVSGQT